MTSQLLELGPLCLLTRTPQLQLQSQFSQRYEMNMWSSLTSLKKILCTHVQVQCTPYSLVFKARTYHFFNPLLCCCWVCHWKISTSHILAHVSGFKHMSANILTLAQGVKVTLRLMTHCQLQHNAQIFKLVKWLLKCYTIACYVCKTSIVHVVVVHAHIICTCVCRVWTFVPVLRPLCL